MCECKMTSRERTILKAVRMIGNIGCFSDEYKDVNARGGDLYGINITENGIQYVDMDGNEWNNFDPGSTAGL